MAKSIFDHICETARIIILLILDGLISATIIVVAYSLKYLAEMFPSEKLALMDISAYPLILSISLIFSLLIYMVFVSITVINIINEKRTQERERDD